MFSLRIEFKWQVTVAYTETAVFSERYLDITEHRYAVRG